MTNTKFKYFKVFGERNTGTNFLTSLILNNTNLLSRPALRDKEKKEKERTKIKLEVEKIIKILSLEEFFYEEDSFYFRFFKNYLKKKQTIYKLIKEKARDQRESRRSNFGWKHSAIDCEEISKNKDFDRTLFICIVRNPWRFISGLYRRPYNIIQKKPSSIKEFIISPIYINQRDNLKVAILDNPVDLWNLKVSSYFKFKDLYPNNVKLIFYEDLIQDTYTLWNLLDQDIIKDFDNINIPSASTKGDKTTYSDYKKEVENYDPYKSLGKEITHLIKERINTEVFIKTPYIKMIEF